MVRSAWWLRSPSTGFRRNERPRNATGDRGQQIKMFNSNAQQVQLDLLLKLSEAAEEAYAFCKEILSLFANRQVDGLLPWLERASRSPSTHIRMFAKVLRHDFDAVVHAFTMLWSNGLVEGQINLLKMLKGKTCGRAGIELPRRRVLAWGYWSSLYVHENGRPRPNKSHGT